MLYEVLEGMPVSIRFLDPPLHEFVPTTEEDIALLAKAQGKTIQQIKLGLNYVSCSPFRVPIARLAAAQAAIM